MDKLPVLRLNPKSPPPLRASAAEFVLEGLYAHHRISRNEERGFAAEERKREAHAGEGESRQRPGYRKQFN
jgi:magnesium chelatase subunit I